MNKLQTKFALQMASKYTKLVPEEHVLRRPDVYIGSTVERAMEDYVVVDGNYKIAKRQFTASPGILRIFTEPMANVVDNFARSRQKGIKATKVVITVDPESGETSIWNDGDYIPVEIHPEQKCYVHSFIFGQLFSSSNYNDDEDRIDISGKNGIGVKATCIFSKKFTVEGVDPVNGKHFTQTWTNNLKSTTGPKVTASKAKTGYTKITYIPDFAQFGIEGYTEDIMAIYKKYAVDMAMITRLSVLFNGQEIPVKSLLDYAKLYSTRETDEYLQIKTDVCEVVVTPSNEFEPISFVNGLYTPLGGVHVDAWTEALFRPIVEKLNKPKRPQVNIGDVKRYFKVFVVATVNRPTFDSQSKQRLESPAVEASVKLTHLRTIQRWPVMELLEEMIRFKELSVLKKVEKKKRQYIEGLSPANNQGGKLGRECILAIVEGESARTYVLDGASQGVLGKTGRDWIGVYAVRGKILNTRNATPVSIAKNTVVTEIIQALGLKQELDYTIDANYHTLQYGKLMIVTDADTDGLHISGLIQNFFHSCYPSLLRRKDPFIISLQTPIVRVYSPKGDILFYDERDFQKYVEEFRKVSPKGNINCKYYKGLGACNEADITETFGRKVCTFYEDDHTGEAMVTTFHKKFADKRKQWLEQYDPQKIVLSWKRGNDPEVKRISHTDYLNTEMIKFSLADCGRSLPSLMDGLKEGHRKVLFACLKRNLKYSGKNMKVAQLAGAVAELSAYHHGEENLYKTITGMGACFIGRNNIPLLYREGQFGTRTSGGADASNARYIWTKLDMVTRLLFRPEDDPLLTYKEEDGQRIEPEFFVPIIPMICVNGCVTGIGTGWSSNIPCYNPLDLIECIKIWLENDGNVSQELEDGTIISSLPELKPWYRGYKGEIVSEGGKKYISWGVVEEIKGGCKVTELPVGMWTKNFEAQLADMFDEKQIGKYRNNSEPRTIDFTITSRADGAECTASGLGLYKAISTSNMVVFDSGNRLRKYDTIDEMICEYCGVRYAYYTKRKEYMIRMIQRELCVLKGKKRFLEEVRNGDIQLFTENEKGEKEYFTTEELISVLSERGYDDMSENDSENTEEDDGEEKKETRHGYDYLLRMQISSITLEKIQKLHREIQHKEAELERVMALTEKGMWLSDIEDFLKVYPDFEKSLLKQPPKPSKEPSKKLKLKK